LTHSENGAVVSPPYVLVGGPVRTRRDVQIRCSVKKMGPPPAFLCHCGAKCGPHKAAIESSVPASCQLNASPGSHPAAHTASTWCMQLLYGRTWLPGGAIRLPYRMWSPYSTTWLPTESHGSNQAHLASIQCLPNNNTQLPYGTHSFHLTPHASHMAYKV
jgi:hypothetical protein